MNKIKLGIVSLLASAGLILTATPALAAPTCVTTHPNPYTTITNCTNITNSTNNTIVKTKVNVNANTGGNTANGNTGNVTITTGSVTSNITITVTGN